MPESTTTLHRFRVRNTGGRAAFKVGMSYWDAFQGRYVWSYSGQVTIETNAEANIDWNLWTGTPATRSIEFHLFGNDTEVDVMTATVRVV